MTVETDKDDGVPSKGSPSRDAQPGRKAKSAKKTQGDSEVGGALRSIYQRTVDERIPPDLLELLGKLG